MTEKLLERIADDVRIIRQELAELKEEVNDLRDVELEVKPEYLEKLDKISQVPFKRFTSVKELREEIETD